MRNRPLADAVRRLAADAAAAYSGLIAGGEQIPFDVAEDSGENSLFYRYVPLTSRFISERSDELRELPSFGPARAAVEEAGVAGAYLEAGGHSVPEAADQQASKMLLCFIADLWDGCTELSLDRARLERALLSLDAETRELESSDVLIAPIIGLHLACSRIQLPSGVRVVRADSIETPVEARLSEGMGREPWEPQFVALAENDGPDEGPLAALGQLQDLISVLRLFKAGGVGLGPHAFAMTAQGTWRRFATGSPATRAGGYHLTEDEASQLGDLARRLEARPDPSGTLAWAVRRFEMGCARSDALEGLTDHLLALRALLDGAGHVGASFPIRVAALVADPAEKESTRRRVQDAVDLERTLTTRGPKNELRDDGAALDLSLWLEETLRAILREAALGALGSDLSVAADETLVAQGLQTGEIEITEKGDVSEWEAITDSQEENAMSTDRLNEEAKDPASHEEDGITRLLGPVPSDEEIRVTSRRRLSPGDSLDDLAEEVAELDQVVPQEHARSAASAGVDWFGEASADSEGTLEWPASQIRRNDDQREPIDTPRVRHLFPVPDNAEWSVPELGYSRRTGGGTGS